MQPILKRCCGIDVHKSMVEASIAQCPLDKPPKFMTRTFSTMTSDLLKLTAFRLEKVRAALLDLLSLSFKDRLPETFAIPAERDLGGRSDVHDRPSGDSLVLHLT